MSAHVEGSRNSCALHGALSTIRAVEGFVPVVHSTAGCGLQHHLGGTLASGGLSAGSKGGSAVSSSNIAEKHVVFGGGSRLREQIKNTVKVVKGELYVVLSGCATEMVGDDIPAMTKEAREQGFPVISAGTPGFRGDVHQGYETAVRGLIEQLPLVAPASEGRIPRLVNLWGIVPQQDVFWQGNLAGLRRLLAGIGVTVNPLFGEGSGLDAWRRVPRAELNIVVSPWGASAARLLEEKYGTPWLDNHELPVGGEQSRRFLAAVAEALGIEPSVVEEFHREESRRSDYHLARIADAYFAFGFQKELALVGETALVSSLAEYLSRTLGLLPETVIITDNPPQAGRTWITDRLGQGADVTKVIFEEDLGEIRGLLLEARPELVIGSRLEEEAADLLDAPLLQVSFPVADRVVLTRGYVGYCGGTAFLEDLATVLLPRNNPAGATRQIAVGF